MKVGEIDFLELECIIISLKDSAYVEKLVSTEENYLRIC